MPIERAVPSIWGAGLAQWVAYFLDPKANIVTATPIQGKPTQIVVRYMDVFVMRDGKWLCVGSQSTKVAPR